MGDPVSTTPLNRSRIAPTEPEERHAGPAGTPSGPAGARPAAADAEMRNGCDEHDDEHLQQYLAKFLRAYNINSVAGSSQQDAEVDRHCIADPAPQPAAVPTPPRGPVADASAGLVQAMRLPAGGAQRLPVEIAKPGKSRTPVTPRRPALPPESHEGLQAMRKLANLNTRGALRTHALRQSVWALRMYSIVGIGSIGTSAALALRTSSASSNTYSFALVALAVAGFCTVRYMRLMRNISRAAGTTSRTHA